jgi:hypothetical protein
VFSPLVSWLLVGGTLALIVAAGVMWDRARAREERMDDAWLERQRRGKP